MNSGEYNPLKCLIFSIYNGIWAHFCFSWIILEDFFSDAVWSTTAEYRNIYFLLTLHANRVLFLGLLGLMRSFCMKIGKNVYDWGRRPDCEEEEEVVALADKDHVRPHLRRLHGRDWDSNPFGGIEKSSAWTAANERLIFKASQGISKSRLLKEHSTHLYNILSLCLLWCSICNVLLLKGGFWDWSLYGYRPG